MATTISSKRQLTISKQAMLAAGLTQGSRVREVIEGRRVYFVADKQGASQVEDGPKILNYKGPKATLDEIKEGIAAGAARAL